jgi:hypothetical protein
MGMSRNEIQKNQRDLRGWLPAFAGLLPLTWLSAAQYNVVGK